MPTMAEVFNRFADEYQKHRLVSFEQQKLIRDIRQCRTYALGGHVTACTACGHIKVHYNSCGNRGCPGCQGVNKEKWILEREYDLLPVKYFHVVFTLPGQLRSICYQNKKLIYNLLFSCAWETLDTFSKDPKQKLQAKMGMIAVLHRSCSIILICIALFRQEASMKRETGKQAKARVIFFSMLQPWHRPSEGSLWKSLSGFTSKRS